MFISVFKKTFVKLRPSLSLKWVVIIPFLLQLSAAVSAVGYFSFKNGEEAVNNLSSQLLSDISNRVNENLEKYTSSAILINKLNAKAIKDRQVNIRDPETIIKQFYNLMSVSPYINFICWGEESRDFYAVSRITAHQNSVKIVYANKSTNYRTTFYEVVGDRQRGRMVQQSRGSYDPRIRPWYQGAVKNQKQGWTKIYTAFDSDIRIITNYNPIYNNKKKLIGVISSDIYFHKFNEFLNQIKVGKTGQIFIMDRDSYIVATSISGEEFRFLRT